MLLSAKELTTLERAQPSSCNIHGTGCAGESAAQSSVQVTKSECNDPWMISQSQTLKGHLYWSFLLAKPVLDAEKVSSKTAWLNTHVQVPRLGR